jgi:hypothetical protein
MVMGKQGATLLLVEIIPDCRRASKKPPHQKPVTYEQVFATYLALGYLVSVAQDEELRKKID